MLSPTALKVFRMKYATHREESWEDAVARITSYIAGDDLKRMGEYYQIIYNKVFLPGGRIIANAGTVICLAYAPRKDIVEIGERFFLWLIGKS